MSTSTSTSTSMSGSAPMGGGVHVDISDRHIDAVGRIQRGSTQSLPIRRPQARRSPGAMTGDGATASSLGALGTTPSAPVDATGATSTLVVETTGADARGPGDARAPVSRATGASRVSAGDSCSCTVKLDDGLAPSGTRGDQPCTRSTPRSLATRTHATRSSCAKRIAPTFRPATAPSADAMRRQERQGKRKTAR